MAAIVYDGPDSVERIDNLADGDVWYQFDIDCWVVRLESIDDRHEHLRYIPAHHVYHVEKIRDEEP